MNPATKDLILDRLDCVRTTLAKTERDQLEEGKSVSAAETEHALKDVAAAIEAIKAADRDLTLPVYRHLTSRDELTAEEAQALQGNEPVAGKEVKEMATLFLQMHDFVYGVAEGDGTLRSREDVRLMQARSQALVDKTRNFTRPLRTS